MILTAKTADRDPPPAGEVNKRDQWLKKAKDIITEYQKRTTLQSPDARTPRRSIA